ncbi:MAG: aminotransferase class V-fold PLP-dependent enzyme [Acidobacteriota bacterium]
MSTPTPPLRDLLTTTLAHALAYRESEPTSPVAAPATYADLHARLGIPLADEPIAPSTVIDDLVRATDGGLHRTTGGRFFGWVIGGTLPSALAADWLTSTWDQNSGAFAVAPAAQVAEEIAGAWLKDLLHLPSEASFALVTGCQLAHVTCLAAARHQILRDHGHDVERDGLFNAPPIRILTSTELHATVNRAARLLGLGESSIVPLPVDNAGRLPALVLEAALATHPSAPTIVLLQAGDVNTGTFDDFATLIPIAKKHNAWVHIDGAFGLWASACPRLAHHTRGVEQADSWATDGHKWLNVPYDCGYAFIRNPDAHQAAFAQHASYVHHDATARNSMDWTPEYSRRARGFSTYAALRELGRTGVASLIDRCCRHAHSIAARIAALPGAQLVSEPTLNQGLVRFLDPSPAADHDAFTDRVTAAILTDGHALFSNTTWRNQRAMRISVSSWRTSDEDVDQVIASVARVLAHLRETPPNA